MGAIAALALLAGCPAGFADYFVDVPAMRVEVRGPEAGRHKMQVVCADIYEFQSFVDLARHDTSERLHEASLEGAGSTVLCPAERRMVGGPYVVVPTGPPRGSKRRTFFIRVDGTPEIYRLRMLDGRSDLAVGRMRGPDQPPPAPYDFQKDPGIGAPGGLQRFHEHVESERNYYESAEWKPAPGAMIAVSEDASTVVVNLPAKGSP